jgi:alcohol dehydrogenase YqhD (iron-dependent ADH family)
LRFFLNTDTTTEDRTYLPLHLLEIATVTIEGNEMKINSVISKDEFKEKLNNILPGVSVKYFTL